MWNKEYPQEAECEVNFLGDCLFLELFIFDIVNLRNYIYWLII